MSFFSFLRPNKENKQVNPIGTKSSSPFVVMMSNTGNVYGFSSFSTREIVNNFAQVAPLNTAVMKIANAVGALPCKIVNTRTKEIVESHPFIDLLFHPNSEIQKTKCDFLRDITLWRILEGDSYIEMTGRVNRAPLQAFVWNPSNIQLLAGRDGFVNEYRRILLNENIGFFKQMIDGRNKFYTKDEMHEMIAWSNFNPSYSSADLSGMSEIQPLFYEINQYLLASNHNLSLLENGARPSGALMLKRKEGEPAVLTTEEFDRLRAQIEDTYSGTDNTGRPIILEGGMEWQEMSLSPKEMDFNISKDKNEQQIYKNLGVPIQLVMDVGATYNNMKEANLFFYENRVLPLADNLFEFLTNNILSRYDNSEFLALEVDRDNVDALMLKRMEFRETIEKSTFMTLDEKRIELGLDELGPEFGGDAIYTSSGVAFAGDLTNISASVEPDDETIDADNDEDNTGHEDDEDNTGHEDDKDDEDNNSTKGLKPKRKPKKRLKKHNKIEKKAHDDFIDVDILNIIGALEQPTVIASTLPLIQNIFMEITEEFGEEFVTEIGINNVFAITNRVERFVRDHSGEFLTQINTTTLAQLRDSVALGFAAGESGQDIFDRIESVFVDSRMSPSSIRRIGETESTRLASAASLESIEQAGLERKEWLTQQDGRVRSTHIELMSQIQPLEENFEIPSTGGVAPAPGGFGLPEEDINCRCAVVAVFETEDKSMDEDEKKQLWFKREGFRITQDAKIQAMAMAVFEIQLNHIRRLLRDRL